MNQLLYLFGVLFLILSIKILAQPKTGQSSIASKKTSTTKPSEYSHLLGEWMRTDENGQETILLLKDDGMGALGSSEFSYKINPEKLIITDYEGNILEYQYVCDVKGITLTGNEFIIPHKFYKKGSDESYIKRVINEPKHLIGKWKNIENGGNVEFTTDGKMIMSGQVYDYTASFEEITFIGSNGSKVIPYNLKGSKLTLDFPNKLLSLKRVNANDVEDPMGAREEKKIDPKRKLPTNTPAPKR